MINDLIRVRILPQDPHIHPSNAPDLRTIPVILNSFKAPHKQAVCLHRLILPRAPLNTANPLLRRDIYRVLGVKVLPLITQLPIIRLRKAEVLELVFMMA